MFRPLVAVVALLALTACSGGESAEPDAPKAGFEVPAGITLTEPGTDQQVGTSVTVAYPHRQDEAGTALALGVAALTKAPRRDLALYSIPDGMVPYYARIMVANRGPAPASFAAGSPWWLHVAGDTLVPASAPPAGFAKCPGLRVPEPLAAGRTVKGCLLFFVPRGTAVESVDFQPGDVTTAVRWTP